MKKILALVLAISTILFSCDNGNNPNNEIQNTPEIDYCKICEGIQNQDHIHDYCLECDGVQTDPSHTCPVIEDPNQYTKKLGDGTYEIHSFMTDTTADNITGRVNEWLPKAETYIKGLANGFSNDCQSNANFQNLINVLKSENTYSTNNVAGFDPIINKINNACTPIFEEIIANIDTPLDRYNFICYYQALSNEAYKYGYGSYFDGNPNNTEKQEKEYSDTLNEINNLWVDNHAFDGITPAFDIINDIQNNNCQQISESMKTLLANSNVASEMGIQLETLNQVINLSLNISSLDSMHDYASSKKLSTHQSCVTDGNTLVDTMVDKAADLDIAIAPAKLNKSIFSQKLDRELC